ncbi:MAG: hypothetical protein K940chlam2_00240 [Chlamydiae bacterium]|nr:hypothetical protein [Chlamydiota bacterium]
MDGPAKRQKRPLSLLELVIGLSLTAILLSSLFTTFRHIAKESSVVQRIHGKTHEKAILQLRLQQIFNTLSKESKLKLLDNNLSFSYDNPYDLEANFCTLLGGDLGLSGSSLFLSSTSPTNERREQKLFENVSEIRWEFYDLKTKKWSDTLKKKRVPLQIKLHLTLTDKQELLFTFQLPKGGFQ